MLTNIAIHSRSVMNDALEFLNFVLQSGPNLDTLYNLSFGRIIATLGIFFIR